MRDVPSNQVVRECCLPIISERIEHAIVLVVQSDFVRLKLRSENMHEEELLQTCISQPYSLMAGNSLVDGEARMWCFWAVERTTNTGMIELGDMKIWVQECSGTDYRILLLDGIGTVLPWRATFIALPMANITCFENERAVLFRAPSTRETAKLPIQPRFWLKTARSYSHHAECYLDARVCERPSGILGWLASI